MIYFIVGALVLLIVILLIIFLESKRKYDFFLTKFSKVEHEIEELLDKKLDLLVRVVPFVEENHPEEVKRLEKLDELKEKQPNNFELFRYLGILKHEVKLILEEHEDLENIKQLKTVLDFLDDTEGQLLGCIEYYNHNVREYQELTQKFPHSITRKLLHLAEKQLYQQVKLEDFEILKK